jgi:hypothetical protein
MTKQQGEAGMKEKSDTYVFISYSRANQSEARDLYDHLCTKAGLTCWMDVFDIHSDQVTFQQQIVRGIQNASCLVMVETTESRNSQYVQLELDTARDHTIPIIHYRVRHTGPKLFRKLKFSWLAQQIKFRITQPLWLSLSLMVVVLAILAAAVFILGAKATPVVAEVYQRMLPSPVTVMATPTAPPPTETPVTNPETLAPFHMAPNEVIFQDNYDSLMDSYIYTMDPADQTVTLTTTDGVLNLEIPKACAAGSNSSACALEIHSPDLPLDSIQYFGARVRLRQSSPYINFSLSISKDDGQGLRTGFGWNFSDHITSFFRPYLVLPEPDYFAYIEMDPSWHAYEITLAPDTHMLTYYIDGQIIGTHQMKHYEEWMLTPNFLIIYGPGGNNLNLQSANEQPDMIIDVDQIIIGNFGK